MVYLKRRHLSSFQKAEIGIKIKQINQIQQQKMSPGDTIRKPIGIRKIEESLHIRHGLIEKVEKIKEIIEREKPKD